VSPPDTATMGRRCDSATLGSVWCANRSVMLDDKNVGLSCKFVTNTTEKFRSNPLMSVALYAAVQYK
jgi:hypothetical protein